MMCTRERLRCFRHTSCTLPPLLMPCFFRPRRSTFLSLFLVLATVSSVLAEDFSCNIETNGRKFDLTSLGKDSASRTRQTPPTTVVDTVDIDICNSLPLKEGVPEGDQCPKGTLVCLTKTNQKDKSDRIVAVIPIASQTLKVAAETKVITGGLSLVIHGDEYPTPNEDSKRAQSLKLTLLCSDTKSRPKFTSYDGSVLSLEWSHPAGCATDDSSKPEDPTPPESSSRGSGVGWFFLVILVGFLLYFILGAYYKYSNYGATGIDLIPHRDFWREVPYMLRDVVSHLCSTIRPRQSSRGGYIAV
ncbi:autophagy-related protein 27 [Flagelloscypha sp. PMI_526]|nr:autophagy-related protein 27 [Flagelloscypha sp. PMI_526]